MFDFTSKVFAPGRGLNNALIECIRFEIWRKVSAWLARTERMRIRPRCAATTSLRAGCSIRRARRFLTRGSRARSVPSTFTGRRISSCRMFPGAVKSPRKRLSMLPCVRARASPCRGAARTVARWLSTRSRPLATLSLVFRESSSPRLPVRRSARLIFLAQFASCPASCSTQKATASGTAEATTTASCSSIPATRSALPVSPW